MEAEVQFLEDCRKLGSSNGANPHTFCSTTTTTNAPSVSHIYKVFSATHTSMDRQAHISQNAPYNLEHAHIYTHTYTTHIHTHTHTVLRTLRANNKIPIVHYFPSVCIFYYTFIVFFVSPFSCRRARRGSNKTTLNNTNDELLELIFLPSCMRYYLAPEKLLTQNSSSSPTSSLYLSLSLFAFLLSLSLCFSIIIRQLSSSLVFSRFYATEKNGDKKETKLEFCVCVYVCSSSTRWCALVHAKQVTTPSRTFVIIYDKH